MSARKLRLALLPALTAVLTVAAVGCGQSAKSPSGAASSSPPTATTASPGSPPATTAPAQPTASPGPPRCSTADLRLTVGTVQGAAGTVFFPLDFTNVSGSTCTMYGYPGVAFVTGPGGSQIGAPAGRGTIGTGAPALITLKPGATAHATLGVSNVLVSTNCVRHQVPVNWVQVYPPDQYRALFTRLGTRGCADRSLVIMGVGPVSSGP